MENIAAWFVSGGSYMYVLLGILAIGSAIVLERLYFYFITCRNMDAGSAGEAAKAIESESVSPYLAKLAKRKDPLSGLLAVAVDRFNSGATMEDVQEGIDEEAISQLPRFSERLSYLSLIANVATLVGLLGTIAGLTDSFASLASVEAAEKAASLAKGIAVAMNTTAFGLIVAIPHMIAYTMLNNYRGKLVKNLDDAVLRFVNFMTKRRKSA